MAYKYDPSKPDWFADAAARHGSICKADNGHTVMQLAPNEDGCVRCEVVPVSRQTAEKVRDLRNAGTQVELTKPKVKQPSRDELTEPVGLFESIKQWFR